MKIKQLLTKTLLVAAALLLGGANSAWAVDYLTTSTGIVGAADNTSGFNVKASKSMPLAAGDEYVITFVNYNKGAEGTNYWANWSFMSNVFSCRADHGESNPYWGSATNVNYTGNSWSDIYSTIPQWLQAYNGVTVTLTVSRNAAGDGITISHTATTNAVDAIASQTYAGTFTATVGASEVINFYLTVENAHLKITKVDCNGTQFNFASSESAYTDKANATTNYNGTTVDNLKLYNTQYRDWGTQDGAVKVNDGGKMSFYKFDLTDIKNKLATDGGTITGVTFSVYGNGDGGDCGKVRILGYNPVWSSSTITNSTATNNAGTIPGTVSRTGTFQPLNTTSEMTLPGAGTTLTANALAYVNSAIEAGKDYVTIAMAANYTRTGLLKTWANLEFTYTATVLYEATFSESNSLNPTVTIYSDAGRTSSVTNGTLADGTTYYYRAVLHGYQNYEGSFTVDGANPSVNFTMTAAEAVTSLNVYAKISGNNYLIKTINLDDKYVGDQVTFNYPRFYKIGTTLYTVSNTHYNTHGGYYKWNNYTLEGSSIVLDYDGGSIENVVYFAEGENISGITADATSNADIRCSDGRGGRSSDELSLTSLGVGQYILGSRVWGNTGVSYTYKAAGGEILTHDLTGALNDKTVYFNVVSGTASITVQGSDNVGGKVIDYVYIRKLDDVDGLVYNGDFENSTWNDGWNGTGTDKATAFAKQTSSQTWGATGNFAEMWTNGSFSTETNLNQILVNVPVGSYILSADILNNVSSSGGVLYAKVGSASDVTTAAEDASGANKSVSFTVAATSNVVVGFKTTALNGKKGWIAVDNFDLAVSKTITAAGWATYCSPYALDFSSAITNLDDAYIVTGGAGGVLAKTSVLGGTVPANTGLLLKGSEGTVNIPVAASSLTDVSANKLVGVTVDTPIDANAGYVLMASPSLAFYKNTNAFTVGANTAYLPANFDTTGASFFSLFDDETTGVADVRSKMEDVRGEVHNLAGQRVAQPAKGLYIVNGKKVVIK